MLKLVVDGQDIFNPIADKLPEIIEYFVKFYGEKYRPRIEEKLTNALFFFVPKSEQDSKPSTILSSYYKARKEDVKWSFFDSFDENFYQNIDEYDINIEAQDLKIIKEKIEQGSYEDADKVLLMMGIELPDEEKERKRETIKFLSRNDFKEGVIKCLNMMIGVWDKHFQLEIEKLEKEEKRTVKYLKSIEEFDGKLEDDYVEEMLNLFESCLDKLGIEYKEDKELSKLAVTFIDFLKEDIDKVTYDNKYYIALFNFLGIDHGDEIKPYLSDPRLHEIFYDELRKQYEVMTENFRRKCFENNIYFNDILQNLFSKGKVYGKNHMALILYNFLNNSCDVGAYMSAIKIDDSVKPICIFPFGLLIDNVVLIHELNHVLETDFYADDKEPFIRCGFNRHTINTDEEELDYSKVVSIYDHLQPKVKNSNCTLLNEVINDYFASKVVGLIGDKLTIGHASPFVSFYSHAFYLMSNFIEENKDILIESRMSDDHDLFARFLGQENFDRLAKAVEELLSIDFSEVRTQYRLWYLGKERLVLNWIRSMPEGELKEEEKKVLNAFDTVSEISVFAREKRNSLKNSDKNNKNIENAVKNTDDSENS